jgi:ABC-type spermidine/putrescine transport system permease subunit I
MNARSRGVRFPRGLWQAFALPGVVWLLAFFLVPFYAVAAIAMGRVDPLFGDTMPVWNPVEWDPTRLVDVLQELFSGGSLQTVFLRTCLYVAIAVALSLVIGYPVAYFISRHGGRWKVTLLLLIIAPFWINYLMRMLSWVNILEEDGYVNDILMFIGLLDAPRNWLDGDPITVVLGLVYGYVPFLILPLYASLDRIDQRLIEAARDLGASPLRAFLRVTLPLSRQGILAGSVIVMLPMFGDYYTPDLLSGSPRTSMFGNQIDFFIHNTAGESVGASLALVLSAFVALLMVYYLISVARSTREAS